MRNLFILLDNRRNLPRVMGITSGNVFGGWYWIRPDGRGLKPKFESQLGLGGSIGPIAEDISGPEDAAHGGEGRIGCKTINQADVEFLSSPKVTTPLPGEVLKPSNYGRDKLNRSAAESA